MKKLIALFLALTFVFSLAACAAKPVVEEPTESEKPIEPEEPIEAQTESSNVNAGVFWCDFSYYFDSEIRKALNEELDTLGITYTDYDAKNHQETQNAQIDSAIADGANLLIVNIVDTEHVINLFDTSKISAAQSVVNKAKDADIPVIFFMHGVYEDVLESYDNAFYISSNGVQAGEAQGEMGGQYIINNYDAVDRNGDGYISYIMMKGTLGNPEAEAREIYCVEKCNAALTAAGKPELVYFNPDNLVMFEPCSGCSKPEAYDRMTTALSRFPMDCDNPIEVVFAFNDDMALGSAEALNDVGFNTGDGDFIPVFGIDYALGTQECIEAGWMTGSAGYPITGTARTIAALVSKVEAGKNLLDGDCDSFEVVGSNILVPYEIHTK